MSERRKPEGGAEPGPAVEEERGILAELLEAPTERPRPVIPGAPCLIAECVDARHPTLQGRVRVKFTDPDGREQQPWVPTLQGLSVRVPDQVLLVRPSNGAEWIVTGVVDGFVRRPEPEKQEAARLELKPDEAVQVVSSAGQKLVEISSGAAGPVVKILERDVAVTFAGKLALKAEEIALEASRGEVTIKATKDVVVKGEVIQLNLAQAQVAARGEQVLEGDEGLARDGDVPGAALRALTPAGPVLAQAGVAGAADGDRGAVVGEAQVGAGGDGLIIKTLGAVGVVGGADGGDAVF
jgi:hypothetical protein